LEGGRQPSCPPFLRRGNKGGKGKGNFPFNSSTGERKIFPEDTEGNPWRKRKGLGKKGEVQSEGIYSNGGQNEEGESYLKSLKEKKTCQYPRV